MLWTPVMMLADAHPLTQMPTPAKPRRTHPLRNVAIGLALLIALCEVAAAEGLTMVAMAEAENTPASTIASIAPDTPLTATLTAVRSHIDLPTTAMINGQPVTELAGVSYRWWLSRGPLDVGFGVGSLGYVVPPSDGRVEGPRTLAGSVPTVSVGWRYHVSPRSAIYADASSARGLGIDGQRDYVNAKVGMEWKPARNKWGFERGSFGVQFDSGYHLSLRARHGGLGLYLRNQF